jgi:hypothetical protein
LRTITVEEHFASPGFVEGPGKRFLESLGQRGRGDVMEHLLEVGDKRVAAMDAAGIDVQVISLNSPGVEQAEAAEAIAVARESNDYLAEAIKKHPTRFGGLAAVPTAAPDEGVKELERAIGQLGFNGLLINGHHRGRYLDDKFFWPILECADALKVPIYLHPTIPPKAVVEASYSGFSPAVVSLLSGAGWGWHIETSVHIIRIILGGVLDRFPNLQFVIGHLGEGIPFMLPRMNRNMTSELTKLERPIGAYLRENLHYTFGGFNFPGTFMNLLLEIDASRIMFSADYPFGSMAGARAFLEQVPVSPENKERIAHGNAEKLFNI